MVADVNPRLWAGVSCQHRDVPDASSLLTIVLCVVHGGGLQTSPGLQWSIKCCCGAVLLSREITLATGALQAAGGARPEAGLYFVSRVASKQQGACGACPKRQHQATPGKGHHVGRWSTGGSGVLGETQRGLERLLCRGRERVENQARAMRTERLAMPGSRGPWMVGSRGSVMTKKSIFM